MCWINQTTVTYIIHLPAASCIAIVATIMTDSTARTRMERMVTSVCLKALTVGSTLADYGFL